MCHICKVTGVRTCDAQEAEIKCEVCGYCKRQEERTKNELCNKNAE